MRIVYIDDDELLLQVAQFFLEATGSQVTCVNDPRLARETVIAVDPDVILLDVVMPGMDGLQTLADLQAAGAVDRAPVIFVTGDATPEDCRRLIEAGGAGVIAKPFTPQTLREQMRRIETQWRQRLAPQVAGGAQRR